MLRKWVMFWKLRLQTRRLKCQNTVSKIVLP
jgi:hypothetical protein